jgi:hypothetical protein
MERVPNSDCPRFEVRGEDEYAVVAAAIQCGVFNELMPISGATSGK